MKIFLLISFLFIVVAVSAQTNVYHPFPDSNAYWNVHTQGCCWSDCSGPPTPNPMIQDDNLTYYFDGDTVINSLTYHKIYRNGYYDVGCNFGPKTRHTFFHEYISAVRTDSTKKVYQVTSWGELCTLYDFSLDVGDTLKSPCWNYGTCTVLLKTDSILIGSTYRKTYWFSGGPFIVIEGMGSTSGLFEPLCPFEFMGDLLCFKQDGKTLYPDTTSTCDMITGISMHAQPSQFSLAPNPFTTTTTLNISPELLNAQLIIYNQLGAVVKQLTLNSEATTISREGISDGIYFFRISSIGGKSITGKLAVQ